MTEAYKRSVKGWRGEVGIIAPYTGVYREWDILAPEGVKFSQVVLKMEGNTLEDIRKLADGIEAEATKLTYSHKDDLICFGCTAGSFIGGLGWDRMIIEKIEKATGITATTASTCVLELFKDMDISKIALVGPYWQSLFDAEVRFLEENGFEVLTVQSLGFTEPSQYWDYYTDPYGCYKLIKDGAKAAPDVDCVFVTCMMSCIAAIVDTVEKEISRPVISSPSATLYGILKKLGIPDPVYHYGQALLRPR